MPTKRKGKLTPKQRKISEPVADVISSYGLIPLKALDNTCPHCTFDEAEGDLLNHCDACCRKIVTELWAYREGLRSRIQREKRAKQKRAPMVASRSPYDANGMKDFPGD